MAITHEDHARLSIYEPLDVESYDIRMLTLLPGSSESDIRCLLNKTSQISPTKYAALSYCWGDPNTTTEIIVNDTATPVTINLADALRQLRRIGVSRIWVDALCINQADRQEKSHQIRNMRQIYSRAEQTYAWVGKEGPDRSAAAISFLHTVLYNSDSTTLAECAHNHPIVEGDSTSLPRVDAQNVATRVPDLSLHDIAPLMDDSICKCCLLEVQFRALQAFFNREYWKRRWIIQEVAVASRIRVLCDNVGIELGEMSEALTHCRRSHYWLVETDNAYRHLQRVLEFRQAYQSGARVSLLRAIAKSIESLSTDPRDRIFALLGICSDGSELVPTPNYKQPIEAVLRRLTRTVIWRTRCLDVILINGMKQKHSTPRLPSWAPNWIRTLSLPKKAFDLASIKPQFDHSSIPMPDAEDENILRVQGVIIGTIVDTTSTLNSASLPRLNSNQVRDNSSSGRSLGLTYYHCESEVFAAFLSCLLTQDGFPVQDQRFWHLHPEFFTAHDHTTFGTVRIIWRMLAWHVLCLLQERTASDESVWNATESGKDPELLTRRDFSDWVMANGAFIVHGKSVQGWFTDRDLRIHLVRILDSKWGYPLCFAIWIIQSVPGLVMALVGIRYYNDGLNFDSWKFTGTFVTSFVLLVLAAMIAQTELFWVASVRSLADDIRHLLFETLQDELESTTRLVVSHEGFIGRTCSRAKIGDQICFLVGCTKPVVLRVEQRANRIQHRVVGPALVALSSRDREKYQGFMQNKSDEGYGDCVPHTWQNITNARRNRLLRQYEESGMFWDFELI